MSNALLFMMLDLIRSQMLGGLQEATLAIKCCHKGSYAGLPKFWKLGNSAWSHNKPSPPPAHKLLPLKEKQQTKQREIQIREMA